MHVKVIIHGLVIGRGGCPHSSGCYCEQGQLTSSCADILKLARRGEGSVQSSVQGPGPCTPGARGGCCAQPLHVANVRLGHVPAVAEVIRIAIAKNRRSLRFVIRRSLRFTGTRSLPTYI